MVMRALPYYKCEECNVLVWVLSGPLTCPKCKQIVLKENNQKPHVTFTVNDRQEGFFLKKVKGEFRDEWKVRRTVALNDLTATELVELAQVDKYLP